MNVLAIIKLELCKMRDTLLGKTSKVSKKEKNIAANWDSASMRDTR
jgi:hypothetical protein